MSASDGNYGEERQATRFPLSCDEVPDRHGLHAVENLDDEVDQLRIAVEHRTIIGQAQGILMARLDIDADRAFDYLRRESMHRNRKVYDLAQEVAEKRRVLDPE